MSEEILKNHNEPNDFDKTDEEKIENYNTDSVSLNKGILTNSENKDDNSQNHDDTKSQFQDMDGKEYTYGLKYDDVINGLTLLANSKKNKGEKIQDIIIYICTAISFVTAIITKNFMAIAAVCLCLGYVYFKTMKPINYMRRAARMIDARKDEYRAILYDKGIKIIENGNEREFLYNTLCYLDHKDLMLVTKDGLVMILPKRYFGNNVETIKETFKSNFKSYKV